MLSRVARIAPLLVTTNRGCIKPPNCSLRIRILRSQLFPKHLPDSSMSALRFFSTPDSGSQTKYQTKSSKLSDSFRSMTKTRLNLPRGQEGDPTLNTVIAAIVGNSCVFLAKLSASFYSGSGVMLAEAFHSAADVANQCLLLRGAWLSKKSPSEQNNYGYAMLKPAYALVSATGIFFIGCLASLFHGYSSLMHPEPLSSLPIAVAVIGASFIMEGATFLYAYRQLKKQATDSGQTVYQYITEGDDTVTVAVFVEDAAAMVGLTIALLSLTSSWYTQNPVFDSVGTIFVGCSMGAVAMVDEVERQIKVEYQDIHVDLESHLHTVQEEKQFQEESNMASAYEDSHGGQGETEEEVDAETNGDTRPSISVKTAETPSSVPVPPRGAAKNDGSN